MKRTVSISEAKDQLPRLVHDTEDGTVVELTRRGRPVAVLLSTEAYRVLRPDRMRVWDDIEALRREIGIDQLPPDDEWLENLRDKRPGRPPVTFD